MYIEIYLDLIILINLLMIFSINLMVKKIEKLDIRTLKVFSISLLGSILSGIFTVYCPVQVNLFAGGVLLCFNTILLCGPRTSRAFVKGYILSILLTILTSGTVLSISSFMLQGRVTTNLIILSTSSVVVFLILSVVKVYIKSIWKQNNIYLLCLMIGNKRLWVKAYLDTGNRLYDDTTNMPVCIIEKDTIEILKSQLILHKIRVKTVSNDTEYLEIFEVSKLKIYDRKEGDKKLENVLFAIANHTLDQNNQFHALLHPDILFS